MKRGVHTYGGSGISVNEMVRIPCLEEGKQYKFLGVLESLMQEDKLVLECSGREYLRRMSMIWSRGCFCRSSRVDATLKVNLAS